MILAVTAYIPIPGHPRSAEEYEMWSDVLFASDIPLLRLDSELRHCWLWQYLQEWSQGFTWSKADNPKKNTVAYHCVQAQKSAILALVANSAVGDVPDVIVWIDLGIYHLPGVTGPIIRDFMLRAENERTIAIPGCWDRDYDYNDQLPCWRFCGGLIVMPRQYANAYDAAMRDEYKRWLRLTNNVSWDVNVLARIEQRGTSLPLWWYKADSHDATMFTNYKRPDHACKRTPERSQQTLVCEKP